MRWCLSRALKEENDLVEKEAEGVLGYKSRLSQSQESPSAQGGLRECPDLTLQGSG